MQKYIEAKRRARGGGKREKMQEVSRKMNAVAKKLGKWDPQATIRRFRDTNLKRRYVIAAGQVAVFVYVRVSLDTWRKTNR